MTKRPPRADPATLAALTADPQNRRRHDQRNLDAITSSLKDVGAARSIVIDEDAVILAGNGVVQAARTAGLTKLRIIEATGDEIIAVRRRGLTDAQKRALAIGDNRSAELATWNVEQLLADQAAGLALGAWWTDEELAALLTNGSDPAEAIKNLMDDEGRPIVEMTFTVSEAQAELINRAVAVAKKAGPFEDSENANANGNALARICDTYERQEPRGSRARPKRR